MFTGIIREIGTVKTVRRGIGRQIGIRAPGTSAALGIGDSVAVNGACLSAVAVHGDSFEADISSETIARTTLGNLRPGMRVNLETSLAADGRFDGHIVQGHVDGTGRIVKVAGTRENRVITIRPDQDPGPLLVDKGSICVDGVSLTVIEPGNRGEFKIAVIPLTLRHTILENVVAGDKVNLEYDIIGKYVARLSKF